MLEHFDACTVGNIQTGLIREMKKENASLYWTVALYLAVSAICVTANRLYPKKNSHVEGVIARGNGVAVKNYLFYGAGTSESEQPAAKSNEMSKAMSDIDDDVCENGW